MQRSGRGVSYQTYRELCASFELFMFFTLYLTDKSKIILLIIKIASLMLESQS